MNSGELDRARAYAATLRTQIHEELDRTLSRDPAFLIVDRRPRMAAKLEQLLRRSGRAADELAIHRAAGEVEALALAATDMWLVSVALEPFGDEVELVQRLRVRYPHAVLLGYGDHPWSRPGALFVAGMELLFDHAELETELPAAAAVVRRRRRTLREGLLHRELSRRVTEKHGPEVARHLGLIPPPPGKKCCQSRMLCA